METKELTDNIKVTKIGLGSGGYIIFKSSDSAFYDLIHLKRVSSSTSSFLSYK